MDVEEVVNGTVDIERDVVVVVLVTPATVEKLRERGTTCRSAKGMSLGSSGLTLVVQMLRGQQADSKTTR